MLNFVLKENIIKKFEFVKNDLKRISIDLEEIVSLKELFKSVTYTRKSLNEIGLNNISLYEAKCYFLKYRLSDVIDEDFIKITYKNKSNYSFYIRISVSKYNRKVNRKKRTVKKK